MFAGRSWAEWQARYAESHQNRVNQVCHLVGIPLIVASVPLAVASPFVAGLWPVPLALFVVGWVFQFVGHWAEGKRPEFFTDWRFLFVGVRWWLLKVRGKAPVTARVPTPPPVA